MHKTKHHLAELAAAISRSSKIFKNSTPIFLTAFGFVEGTLVLKASDEIDPTIKTYFSFYNNVMEQNTTENSFVIFLKNVQVTTSMNLKYKLPFLMLYSDQIIGISLQNPTVPLLDITNLQHILQE